MSPLYLADTSAWHRSGRVEERWEAHLDRDELALCGPVTLELLWSSRTPGAYATRAADLDLLPHLPLDDRATRAARRTQSSLAERSQHHGPSPIDLLVAAIAEVNGAVLLHYDRHFDAIRRVTGQPMEWLARRGSIP